MARLHLGDTLGGGDHRECDPRVPGGGLDERGLARLDVAALLGLGDHRVADPVLHRVTRLERLELAQDGRVQTRCAMTARRIKGVTAHARSAEGGASRPDGGRGV